MRIKNLLKIIALSFFIALMMPVRSNAATLSSATTVTTASPSDSATDSKIAAQIIQRVNEIQAMDRSNLSTDEKKALRKELMGLKKQASGLDSKVYLSVGAIIIIILILILILK